MMLRLVGVGSTAGACQLIALVAVYQVQSYRRLVVA